MKESLYIRLRRRVTYEVYVRKFERHPTRPGDVVFLGDSITGQGDWARWFRGQPVAVRGIGGDSAHGLLARLGPVLDRPSKLFLMIGTNDVWVDSPTETILATVRQILETIRSASPATELYVQSVTPRSDTLAPAIRAVNAGYAALAAEFGATYVELFDLLCGPGGGLRPGYSTDELHLQAEPYEIWREAVRPLVES